MLNNLRFAAQTKLLAACFLSSYAPHLVPDEPELRILASRVAADKVLGSLTYPASSLAPAAARRSAAAPSSVEQPAEPALPAPSDGECAAVFTPFDTLEAVAEWLKSLPMDEQNTAKPLQRLGTAVKACTARSGMQAKVQKLCND